MRRAQAREKAGKGAATPTRAIPRMSTSRARPAAGAAGAAGGGGVLGWRPQFLVDIITELRKVVWPSRQDTTYLTIVVVIVTIILGALLGAIDIGFGWLIDKTLLR